MEIELFSAPHFPDGWTTNDLIYKWKEINPVQLTKNLSLPGGFKLANYSNHQCDVVTATGGLEKAQHFVTTNQIQLLMAPEVLAPKHESRILRHCWDVFKIGTVFLSCLLVKPLLLFSAQILA